MDVTEAVVQTTIKNEILVHCVW